MMQIVLCDDNPLHLEETVRVLREKANENGETVVLRGFSTASQLLQSLQEKGCQPEIAILDIAMEEMDGIALAKQINEAVPFCQVIFLTGYLRYATDVYEADHVYFLLKSELKERIWPAVMKAHAHYTASVKDCFLAQTSSGTLVCRYGDICYFERVGRKTRLHGTHGDVWIRETIKTLRETLLPDRFLLCHHSFLVNPDQIAMAKSDSFLLRDGTRVPISHACKKAALEKFYAYINAAALDR